MFRNVFLRFGLIMFLFVLIFIGTEYIRSYRPCCGDVEASIKTWMDINGNGTIDSGEKPLPGVCFFEFDISNDILMPLNPLTKDDVTDRCSSAFYRTDENGEWSDFKAGGNCTEIYLLASPPKGYQLTTESVVNDCYAQFGFQPISLKSAKPIMTPVEFSQRKAKDYKLKLYTSLGAIFLISTFLSFLILPVRRKK